MPTVAENDVRYCWSWNPETAKDFPKKIRFKDTIELDLEEGYEVLLFINSYMELKNLGMKCTFEKIEHILTEELPQSTRSLNKIKRFISDNYFF